MNALLDKLLLGELDVVVGRLDNYQPRPEFRSEILFLERICIVSRLRHPLAQRGKLSWDEVYRYDWIVWPLGTPIRSKLDMALTAAGRKPPHYRVDSTSQVGNLWLLQHTDMLAVTSERVALHFNDRGLLAPLDIDIEAGDGSVGWVWRDDPHPDGALHDLLECVRESKKYILSGQLSDANDRGART